MSPAPGVIEGIPAREHGVSTIPIDEAHRIHLDIAIRGGSEEEVDEHIVEVPGVEARLMAAVDVYECPSEVAPWRRGIRRDQVP
jgi:hypothetical protein